MEDHKTIPGSELATSRDLIRSEAITATPWLSDNNTVPLCSLWQVGRQGNSLSGPREANLQPQEPFQECFSGAVNPARDRKSQRWGDAKSPCLPCKIPICLGGITSLLELSPENRAPEPLPETQVQG